MLHSCICELSCLFFLYMCFFFMIRRPPRSTRMTQSFPTRRSSDLYRPLSRGVAMNPVDHPHGGGEGKTSGGRPSVSFSGILTKGYSTAGYKIGRAHV